MAHSLILGGGASGLAAALALDAGCAVSDVPIHTLQEQLDKTGVIIHFDDAWKPASEPEDCAAALEGHI